MPRPKVRGRGVMTGHLNVVLIKNLIAEELGDDDGAGGIGKMFSDPNLIAKLASNPKTAPLLSDPSFVAKVRARSSDRTCFASETDWSLFLSFHYSPFTLRVNDPCLPVFHLSAKLVSPHHASTNTLLFAPNTSRLSEKRDG